MLLHKNTWTSYFCRLFIMARSAVSRREPARGHTKLQLRCTMRSHGSLKKMLQAWICSGEMWGYSVVTGIGFKSGGFEPKYSSLYGVSVDMLCNTSYTNTHMCTYIQMHIHLCIYIYIYIYSYACVYICRFICICMYIGLRRPSSCTCHLAAIWPPTRSRPA